MKCKSSIMCRLGFHRWIVVYDTTVHLYCECSKCGLRQVFRTQLEGHQPIGSWKQESSTREVR